MNSVSKDCKRLSWKQACVILGCGKTTFYRLVHSGRLPAYKIQEGRGLWVYEEDCLRLIERVELRESCIR